MKFIKKNYKVFLLIILIMFYFNYAVSITWDSAHYLGYLKILQRQVPFSSWDVVRGPIFPLIIYFGNILFSHTSHGLLVNTFIYYLIMLFFVKKIIVYILNDLNFNNKFKKVIEYIIIFLIIINPIIYGYYHCLLTEFVAITLSVVSCYLCIIWLNLDFYENKKKYIFVSLIFVFLTIFSWFLKQPYVSCGFFALIITYTISIFENHSWKQLLVRTATVLCCIFCLIMSIKIWNHILDSHGANSNTTRNPSNGLGLQLITAVDYLNINNKNEIYDVNFIKSSNLSKKEKNEVLDLLNAKKKYILIYKYNKMNEVIDVDYIETKNPKMISMSSSIKYLIKTFIDNPIKLIKSYINNYFCIIDIYRTTTTDGIGYESEKKFDINFSNELTVIGNKPYSNVDSNFFPLSDELYQNAINYYSPNHANEILNKFMLFMSMIFIYIFKFIFAFLPISLIITIIMCIKCKNIIIKNLYNVLIILFGFSLLHVLLHTFTGAIIDRYALPAFISTFIGIIFLPFVIFNDCKKNSNIKKCKNCKIVEKSKIKKK